MRDSGLSHLTAVCGGNVAIVLGLVFALVTRRSGCPCRLRVIAATGGPRLLRGPGRAAAERPAGGRDGGDRRCRGPCGWASRWPLDPRGGRARPGGGGALARGLVGVRPVCLRHRRPHPAGASTGGQTRSGAAHLPVATGDPAGPGADGCRAARDAADPGRHGWRSRLGGAPGEPAGHARGGSRHGPGAAGRRGVAGGSRARGRDCRVGRLARRMDRARGGGLRGAAAGPPAVARGRERPPPARLRRGSSRRPPSGLDTPVARRGEHACAHGGRCGPPHGPRPGRGDAAGSTGLAAGRLAPHHVRRRAGRRPDRARRSGGGARRRCRARARCGGRLPGRGRHHGGAGGDPHPLPRRPRARAPRRAARTVGRGSAGDADQGARRRRPKPWTRSSPRPG